MNAPHYLHRRVIACCVGAAGLGAAFLVTVFGGGAGHTVEPAAEGGPVIPYTDNPIASAVGRLKSPTCSATRRAIMKVLALGLFAKPLTDEQRKPILLKEVPDTLRLYLDGKIDQFWFREDKPGGVVFLMNCTSVEEAKSIIEALPLAANRDRPGRLQP